MNPHQIFKEMFNLDDDDTIYDLKDIMQLVEEARNDYKNVGVEFSLEKFKEYAHRRYDPIIQASTTKNSRYEEQYARQLKIIDGDNLDIIEDAAKDRGLL